MYALVEFAGKQFKIEEGTTLKVPRIDGKVGSKVTMEKVLYFDDGKQKKVGTPFVKGINIDGEILSHSRGNKVVVFKFKRRKGYQRKNSHRQDFSILKVGKLIPAKKKATPKKKGETSKPAPKSTVKKTAPKKKTKAKTTKTKKTTKE